MDLLTIILLCILYVIGIFFTAYKLNNDLDDPWYAWIILIVSWWFLLIAQICIAISMVFRGDWEDIN